MTLIVSVSDFEPTSWFCGLSVTSLYKSFSYKVRFLNIVVTFVSVEDVLWISCRVNECHMRTTECVNSLLGVLGKSCLSNSSWLSVFLLLASLTQESNSLVTE